MFIILLISGAISLQAYEFPAELTERYDGIFQSTTLSHSDTLRLSYSWHDISKTIKWFGFRRGSTSAPWNAFADEKSVSYTMTATAPYYPTQSVYVAGVYESNGMSIIEKWTPTNYLPLPGGGFKVVVSKEVVYLGTEITHVRAMAVAPNEQFLVFSHHETGEVRKLSLSPSPPAITAVVQPSSYPTIPEYNTLVWERHITLGDVVIMDQSRNSGDSGALTNVFLIWDLDVDGVPNQIEEISSDQYDQYGYNDEDSWILPFEWVPG